ncbi:hypothetical protein OA860_01590 [Prochlorococcus sp. AH-716-E13]|nr:hypothetical protein [Prochlorococcus sp. AH-716-E13]
MSKDFESGKVKRLPTTNLNLPNFVNNSFGNHTKVNFVEGTNVIRVPFGKRFPKKQRPNKNQNIATLILPINFINPTPPPNVA